MLKRKTRSAKLKNKIMAGQKYYTPIEFADKINRHYRTILRRIKSKKIRAIDMSDGGNRKNWRIPSEELAKYV